VSENTLNAGLMIYIKGHKHTLYATLCYVLLHTGHVTGYRQSGLVVASCLHGQFNPFTPTVAIWVQLARPG